MKAIGHLAAPLDHGQHRGTARTSTTQTFQHQGSGALCHNEALAVLTKGSRCRSWRIVTGR